MVALTSADAAGDLVVVLDVSGIFFDKGGTRCAFDKRLRTRFIRHLLHFLLLEARSFGCELLRCCLSASVRFCRFGSLSFRILLDNLIHLLRLLLFQFLICGVMLVCLTEILGLDEGALIIRTRPHTLLHIGHTLWRRVILLGELADLVCGDVGRIRALRLASKRANPFLIVPVVHFLAFRWLHV